MISFDQPEQSKPEKDIHGAPASHRPTSSTSSQAYHQPSDASALSQPEHLHHAPQLDSFGGVNLRQDASLAGLSLPESSLRSPGISFDPLDLSHNKRVPDHFDSLENFGHVPKRPRLEGPEEDPLDLDLDWVWPVLPLSPSSLDFGLTMPPPDNFPTHETGFTAPHSGSGFAQVPAVSSGSDYRRLSVSSLLSGPDDGEVDQDKKASGLMRTDYLRSTT